LKTYFIDNILVVVDDENPCCDVPCEAIYIFFQIFNSFTKLGMFFIITCRVERLMNKHLRIQKRSNPHTLFFYLWTSHNICSPPSSPSNIAKIVEFNKRMGKIWGVWWNGVWCLVMAEIKHIWISKLKLLIITSLPFGV